jgi:hypothetical protein
LILKRNHLKNLILLLFCFGLSFGLNAQFYNGTQTDFGKNRVQYDDFEWQFYKFRKFETYFYTGGKELAEHTAKYVNQRITKIEKYLDFSNNEPIQFVIYNKQSHFRQSNIGLASNENNNIGGVTNIVGSKVFIYFEGDYELFDKQIEAGIYRVLIYQMIFGGNWREVLRNTALLHLPEWYISGLISFLIDPDNPNINNQIENGIIQKDFKRINSLTGENAKIAGHSMWKYVANSYGKNVISNILYMTRLSRNIEDGYLYVLGVSLDDLFKNWLEYYNSKILAGKSSAKISIGQKVELKTRKDRVYQNLTQSPNRDLFAYNTNKLGQFKIYVFDNNTKKKKKIFSDEHKLDRIQDYTYPIISWHPNGKVVSFIIEKKGRLLLYSYNTEDKTLNFKPIFKLEKVLSFQYSQDGKQIIFSGVSKGQSDLYLYKTLGNTQSKLTNDIYDDLNPSFTNNDEDIVFVSSRNNDSLNLEHSASLFRTDKDIFSLNIKSGKILSVTDTDKENEIWPISNKKGLFFHSKKDGNIIRHSAQFDSSIIHIDTVVHYNYFYSKTTLGRSDKSIFSTSGDSKSSTISQISFHDDRYHLYTGEIDAKSSMVNSTKKEENQSPLIVDSNIDVNAKPFIKVIKPEVYKEVNINDYKFSTANEKKEVKEVVSLEENPQEEDLNFPTQRIYRPNFKTDNSILQLNNAFMNGQYQIFNGGPFTSAGLGINSKIGIVDLFEDYRVYGGIRISGDIQEYSLNYQNLKNRLDKEYSISRRTERVTNDFSGTDIKTNQISISFKWPFSEITSIRGVFSTRNDKIIPLSTELNSLVAPITNNYWATAKTAYVYDNTQTISLNIKTGTRFKVFAEQYQLLYSEAEETQYSDLSVLGFDFRNYQKLHKEIIFVSRIAGSKSFGTNPLVYYLGGVDEWWKSDQFDESTPISNTENYGFQSLAANMRGFLQNIRNGNNFVVINTELRLPLFTYFINKPIQSDFIRNFQLIGFGDLGTAWIGNSPFANDNPINNETITTGPITITYENINDPIVGGVGLGFRTTLLGYFMRFDWGWGYENGVLSDKSLFMFSLSLDI